MSSLLDELVGRLEKMPDKARKEIADAAMQATKDMIWIPTPGPQTEAYFSEADDLFYGGSAGGGKSELGLGLALTAHEKSLILRRVGDDARDLYDRAKTILDTKPAKTNAQLLTIEFAKRKLKMAGFKNEQDKERAKGKPYDLYVFDEVGDFSETQFRFIKTWNRSTTPGQRCRVLATGNPPTTAEGLWVIQYWAAWLDPTHPNPAKEGELRWYVQDKTGKEHEVQGKGPHVINHEDGSTESVFARSRTFIRARLADNPYLAHTDYAATLDALPAELRAAYRDGRFDLSLKDNPRQIIPTSWVIAANKRWEEAGGKPPKDVPMCAIGTDVAQGGPDETVLAPRYDGFYDHLDVTPGEKTPNGKSVIARIIQVRKNSALIIVDMGGGYGGATKELLEDNSIPVVGYKGATESYVSTKCKNFGFKNKRSEALWRFREALDPDQPGGSSIMLPPDAKLTSDLTATTFDVKRGKGGRLEIVAEKKEDVKDRIGRSPDRGDAVVMAWTDGPKADSHLSTWQSRKTPEVRMGHGAQRQHHGGQVGVNMGHNGQRRR